MLIQYQKPPLTFEKQLNRLKEKGLLIHDKQNALNVLSCISYERFKAYLVPFKSKENNKQLKPDTTFDNVYELYEFDRELRLLVMDAIEWIEVAVRTRLTYHIAHKYGIFAHEEHKFFHERNKDKHAEWLVKIHENTNQSSSSNESIKNYKNKYKGFPTIPIWMLTEVISFGQLSLFYTYLKSEDKRKISEHFKLNYKTLKKWLHVLNHIRNICAHHSRIWNKKLTIKPPEYKKSDVPNDRIFYILLMLYYLLKKIEKDSNWKDKIVNLIKPIVEKYSWTNKFMGIPDKGLEEIEKLSNVFERSFKQDNS